MPTTRRGRPPTKKTTAARKRSSTAKKTSRKPARKRPSKKRRSSRNKLVLIVAVLVALGAAVGIFYYQTKKTAIQRTCLSHQRDITTFVLGLLFQRGFSSHNVSWHSRNGITIFDLRGNKRSAREVYTLFSEKLARHYHNLRVKMGKHGGILILCGKRVTHRLVFIQRPVSVPYAEEKGKGTPPPPAPPTATPLQAGKKKVVRVAIVIDDIGNDLNIAKKLLDLPVPITLSIFPFAPYSKEIAHEALLKGHVILMHLPMEPEGYPRKGKDPGPGALYVKMKPDEVKKQLLADLDRIPQVCGINNHMGSRFTCDSLGMKTVMEVLKEKKKIFLDSRTIAASVGYKIAREEGVPTARRDVFLDNLRDVKRIREQLDHLIHIAKKRGYAIGIGHPHRATYLTLKKAIPEYLKDGVKFVYITALVH